MYTFKLFFIINSVKLELIKTIVVYMTQQNNDWVLFFIAVPVLDCC